MGQGDSWVGARVCGTGRGTWVRGTWVGARVCGTGRGTWVRGTIWTCPRSPLI